MHKRGALVQTHITLLKSSLILIIGCFLIQMRRWGGTLLNSFTFVFTFDGMLLTLLPFQAVWSAAAKPANVESGLGM